MDAAPELIRDIYNAALDDSGWQKVIADTAREVGAHGGVMLTLAVPESQGGFGAFHAVPVAVSAKYHAEASSVYLMYQAVLQRAGKAIRTGATWNSDELLHFETLGGDALFLRLSAALRHWAKHGSVRRRWVA